MPRNMTAVFPRQAQAEKFVTALRGPGWFVTPGTLSIEGCTVTWRTDGREDDEPAAYVMDMRQTVAYYGSGPVAPFATLNGTACRGW